jgi:hypothetical protein
MRDIIESKLANTGVEVKTMFNMSEQELFEYFCDRFSLREPIVKVVADTEMVKENARMRDELKTLYGVDKPFICGVAGDVQEDKLNEYILVCPAYGADGFAMYKKYKNYSAPEY